MLRRATFIFASLIAWNTAAGAVHAAVISTFDDLSLAPNSFYAPGAAANFTSGAGTFIHSSANIPNSCPVGGCIFGWTYSNKTDTTTYEFGHASSAYAGSGADGAANYAVGYGGIRQPTIKFASPSIVAGAYFTNTTQAALVILNGEGEEPKFGNHPGHPGDDWFRLDIIGNDAAGVETGTVQYYLADYRFSNDANDYVRKSWGWVDLTSLGAVSMLTLVAGSSRIGAQGSLTPAFFAMDNLSVIAVPEPGTAFLLLTGSAMLLLGGMRGNGTGVRVSSRAGCSCYY